MKNNHQTKMKVEVITRKSKDKWTPLDDVRVFEWRLGEKGVKSKDWQKRPALARLNNVIIHSAPRTIIVVFFITPLDHLSFSSWSYYLLLCLTGSTDYAILLL
jgi:hypothetical protein